jgi:hypothetical protein
MTRLTGLRAADLAELVGHLRDAPPSVVFHHTHHYLVQHQYLSPEPPNDFAFWVTNVLQEESLGERLAAIDTVQFRSLRELRDRIVAVVDEYLEASHQLRAAPAGEEFHFMDAVSFALRTGRQATTLAEFAAALRDVGTGTIAYHLFEARVRHGVEDNDFSNWLEHALGEVQLAEAIRRLDPYTYTMEGLRRRLIGLIERRLAT